MASLLCNYHMGFPYCPGKPSATHLIPSHPETSPSDSAPGVCWADSPCSTQTNLQSPGRPLPDAQGCYDDPLPVFPAWRQSRNKSKDCFILCPTWEPFKPFYSFWHVIIFFSLLRLSWNFTSFSSPSLQNSVAESQRTSGLKDIQTHVHVHGLHMLTHHGDIKLASLVLINQQQSPRDQDSVTPHCASLHSLQSPFTSYLMWEPHRWYYHTLHCFSFSLVYLL